MRLGDGRFFNREAKTLITFLSKSLLGRLGIYHEISCYFNRIADSFLSPVSRTFQFLIGTKKILSATKLSKITNLKKVNNVKGFVSYHSETKKSFSSSNKSNLTSGSNGTLITWICMWGLTRLEIVIVIFSDLLAWLHAPMIKLTHYWLKINWIFPLIIYVNCNELSLYWTHLGHQNLKSRRVSDVAKQETNEISKSLSPTCHTFIDCIIS